MAPAAMEPTGGRRDDLRRALERGMADYAFDEAHFGRTLEAGGPREARLQSLVLAMAPAKAVAKDLDEAARVRALVADPVFQLR